MYKVMIFHSDNSVSDALFRIFQKQRNNFKIVKKEAHVPDALDFLKSDLPDMIFFEIGNSIEQSFAIADYIERMELPIMTIAVSNKAEFSYVVEAIQHHVNDFMTVPIAAKAIQNTISRFQKKKIQCGKWINVNEEMHCKGVC